MYVIRNWAKQLWEHVTDMHMPNYMYNCLTRIVQACAKMKCSHVTKLRTLSHPLTAGVGRSRIHNRDRYA